MYSYHLLFSKVQTISAITSFLLISSAGYEKCKSHKIAESDQEKYYYAYVKKNPSQNQTQTTQNRLGGPNQTVNPKRN